MSFSKWQKLMANSTEKLVACMARAVAVLSVMGAGNCRAIRPLASP
jgi:hypothetical protein